MKFTQNIGTIDRIMRLIIGLIMIYFGLYSNVLIADEIAGTLLGVFGVFILLTAIVRFCPMYLIIGFSSDKKE